MELNIKQRFFATSIYIIIICSLGFYMKNDLSFLLDRSNPLYLLFVTSGLMLILGTFITEPFFTKPINVIAKSIAIILVLLGIKDSSSFYLYYPFLYFSMTLLVLSVVSIIFLEFKRVSKFQKFVFQIITTVGRPEFLFSVLYLLILFSYFQDKQNEFSILFGFWLILICKKPVILLTKWIWGIFISLSSKTDSRQFLGQIIGHESNDLYKVEITNDNPLRQWNLTGKLVYLENIVNGVAGIILSERILLGKKWVEVLSLRDNSQNLISFNINSFLPFAEEKTIFSKTNSVYLLDLKILDKAIKSTIENHPVNINFKRLIGTVWAGSTINKIRFNKLFTVELQKTRNIGEGSIIQTEIANEEVLYQIIDARTDEENLEFKDTYGFTIGTAQKLGKYITSTNELNTVKWLPEIYTPIILLDPLNVPYNSNIFIGKLPNTNYGIPIRNPHELVTHNTAILGILGIGKSCLVFELLQKLLSTTEVKIFCIDLTNQYSKELSKYISPALVQIDFDSTQLSALKAGNATGVSANPSTWGNEVLYKSTITSEIDAFIASGKRVITINPDLHNVSKPGSQFNITHKVDLTPAEKVRLISERLIVKASSLGETADARYLIVFEEAHSLVPEWNSIANEGDKNATNGTAKVILQGRKFGMGSFVIAQRTANISKSILNQCNTIFAMRVFDDTGKQFLENYIGSDYSNLLPTLEERHCIAIGKALKLKQPLILELNEMNDIILPPANIVKPIDKDN